MFKGVKKLAEGKKGGGSYGSEGPKSGEQVSEAERSEAERSAADSVPLH